MSIKSNVRKLPGLSSYHIPITHRRFQNRAAAVYDMSIECHDIQTVCHIHRLPESVILQDWKGNFDYLQSRLNLNHRKEIEKRFSTIIKEIKHQNIQPTLAAIAHHIPFVYIEQAIADHDVTSAINRFLEDFNPKKIVPTESKEENPIQKHLNNGHPVLTAFEQSLLLEHLIHSISSSKLRRIVQIEKCLLQHIQLITKVNYASLNNISYLNKTWLLTFLRWAEPQMTSLDTSWLDCSR